MWGDDSGGTEEFFLDRPQPNQDIIKFLKGPEPNKPEQLFAT